jgi:hypothetical protein
MRRLAVEFAGALRSDAKVLVHDALKLASLCTSAPPPEAEPMTLDASQSLMESAFQNTNNTRLIGVTLYVDNVRGSDTNGDGSAEKPFCGLEKGRSSLQMAKTRCNLRSNRGALFAAMSNDTKR